MKLGRVVRIGVLALVAVVCVGGSSLRAQQAPSAPDQHQGASEPERVTPGRELARESREAAGEQKDEFEQFKHVFGADHFANHRMECAGVVLGQHVPELRRHRGRHNLGGAQVSPRHLPG